MNIILLGPPGAGKGTQAELISQKGYVHLSVGDILRQEAEVDATIDRYLKEGRLVPLSTIEGILKKFLLGNKHSNVLFDGVPRNLEQVSSIDNVMKSLQMDISKVFYLKLDQDEIRKRILNRWICIQDGESKLLSGTKDEVEMLCKGTLQKRSDDTEETLKNRLAAYENETKPVIELYRKRGLLVEIDASRTREEVFNEIWRNLSQ